MNRRTGFKRRYIHSRTERKGEREKGGERETQHVQEGVNKKPKTHFGHVFSVRRIGMVSRWGLIEYSKEVESVLRL